MLGITLVYLCSACGTFPTEHGKGNIILRVLEMKLEAVIHIKGEWSMPQIVLGFGVKKSSLQDVNISRDKLKEYAGDFC